MDIKPPRSQGKPDLLPMRGKHEHRGNPYARHIGLFEKFKTVHARHIHIAEHEPDLVRELTQCIQAVDRFKHLELRT